MNAVIEIVFWDSANKYSTVFRQALNLLCRIATGFCVSLTKPEEK
jgi:hypothetical protein